jgi:hypothetical protein
MVSVASDARLALRVEAKPEGLVVHWAPVAIPAASRERYEH